MAHDITITGATGWLGLALLDVVQRVYGASALERVHLYGSKSRIIAGTDGISLPVQALHDLSDADLRGHLVFHFAALTRDRVSEMTTTDFYSANRLIDDAVLKAMERNRPHAVFVASSGAAALHDDPYAIGKREQEQRFLGTGVPTLAGRLYNLAGPHINKLQGYVLSSCIVQARDTGRIVLTAEHPVYRAYAHVTDVMTVMLAALNAGQGYAKPVDIAGDQVVEVQEIATAVTRHLPAMIERPTCDETRSSHYVGDPQPLRDLAAQFDRALSPFGDQVADTVRFLCPQI